MERKGYVRSHRKTADSEIWQMDDRYFKLFMLLIWNAVRVPGELFGHVLATCGQLAEQMPKKGSYTRHTIRNMLITLSKKGLIDFESDGEGVDITIINYRKYQFDPTTRVLKATIINARSARTHRGSQLSVLKPESDEYQRRFAKDYHAAFTRKDGAVRAGSRADSRAEKDQEMQWQSGFDPFVEHEVTQETTRSMKRC